mmetsp:Transcript_94665/g.263333  ORF Transcript_94665/g.263333 Transcript_94665/m.263333 type:complete len:203 (-) Transcript_94665:146-754(-)
MQGGSARRRAPPRGPSLRVRPLRRPGPPAPGPPLGVPGAQRSPSRCTRGACWRGSLPRTPRRPPQHPQPLAARAATHRRGRGPALAGPPAALAAPLPGRSCSHPRNSGHQELAKAERRRRPLSRQQGRRRNQAAEQPRPTRRQRPRRQGLRQRLLRWPRRCGPPPWRWASARTRSPAVRARSRRRASGAKPCCASTSCPWRI